MAIRITEEYLIEKLTNFVSEHGRAPKISEFGHYSIINKFFGSYTEFLKSQNVSKKIDRIRPTKAELSAQLHAYVRKNRRVPKAHEFKNKQYIYSYYDSFPHFVESNGYFTSSSKENVLTKETLFNELQTFINENGRIPSFDEFGHRSTIYRKFGSYEEFIHEQGFSLNTERFLPEEKLSRKLKTYVLIVGQLPDASEFGHETQVNEFFGSFPAFLQANGYHTPPQSPIKRFSLIGERFGQLLVVSSGEKQKQDPITWNCLCDCGNHKNNVPRRLLVSGTIQSCGCSKKESSTLLHSPKS